MNVRSTCVFCVLRRKRRFYTLEHHARHCSCAGRDNACRPIRANHIPPSPNGRLLLRRRAGYNGPCCVRVADSKHGIALRLCSSFCVLYYAAQIFGQAFRLRSHSHRSAPSHSLRVLSAHLGDKAFHSLSGQSSRSGAVCEIDGACAQDVGVLVDRGLD